MSLREEYDRAVSEKDARLKQEETLRSRDHLLCQEARALYERDQGQRLDGMYDYSLPIQLPPESRALVVELISLCPPAAWKRVPSTVDPSKVRFFGKTKGSYYIGPRFLQYRLPDGSVHVGQVNVHLEESPVYVRTPFRFTLRGLEAAGAKTDEKSRQLTKELLLEKTQQVLDEIRSNPRLTSSHEYIEMRFNSSIRRPFGEYGDNFENYIVIFRDGIVYDPYPMRMDEDRSRRRLSLPETAGWLHYYCSELVRQWAAMA